MVVLGGGTAVPRSLPVRNHAKLFRMILLNHTSIQMWDWKRKSKASGCNFRVHLFEALYKSTRDIIHFAHVSVVCTLVCLISRHFILCLACLESRCSGTYTSILKATVGGCKGSPFVPLLSIEAS